MSIASTGIEYFPIAKVLQTADNEYNCLFLLPSNMLTQISIAYRPVVWHMQQQQAAARRSILSILYFDYYLAICGDNFLFFYFEFSKALSLVAKYEDFSNCNSCIINEFTKRAQY